MAWYQEDENDSKVYIRLRYPIRNAKMDMHMIKDFQIHKSQKTPSVYIYSER